jgi:uncharacterized membrane protein YphA (DoxX/SURF4 family)
VDLVPIIASVIVGVTFLVAGGSKVANQGSWLLQAVGLGAPKWSALIVPWVEIVVGAALVAQLWRPWSVLAALVVLIAFTALIAGNLARDRHPPCACFGAWSASPIGVRHLVRNGVLIVLAVVALA